MKTNSTIILYHFTQSFKVSSNRAYQWCTDFTPEDHILMGEEQAKREVTQLSDNTIFLKETFNTNTGGIEKQKLIHLYPDLLSWVSTHISGPNKYSQFIYKIQAKDSTSSCLNFIAHHIEYPKEVMTTKDIKLLADKLCKYDANVWKLLAKALEDELNK